MEGKQGEGLSENRGWRGEGERRKGVKGMKRAEEVILERREGNKEEEMKRDKRRETGKEGRKKE